MKLSKRFGITDLKTNVNEDGVRLDEVGSKRELVVVNFGHFNDPSDLS